MDLKPTYFLVLYMHAYNNLSTFSHTVLGYETPSRSRYDSPITRQAAYNGINAEQDNVLVYYVEQSRQTRYRNCFHQHNS